MSKRVLITGAYGFIGRYTAKQYKKMGYMVIGLGHGDWLEDEHTFWGIDFWHSCDITMENLILYAEGIDVIVHCAGSGSVGFSIKNPMLDFERTVSTTQFVLEYIRKYAPKVKLVYPSSAAVYGMVDKLPITTEDDLNPISPYGVHKKIAEELCQLYCKQYNISVAIIRLFSVYGEGLEKQLLWDACKKIEAGNNLFWGTGEETRDWIHVSDVAELLYIASKKANSECIIVNGGSGKNISISKILECLFYFFDSLNKPKFGGEKDIGNPAHYLADIAIITKWGWSPKIDFETGIDQYVQWYKGR